MDCGSRSYRFLSALNVAGMEPTVPRLPGHQREDAERRELRLRQKKKKMFSFPSGEKVDRDRRSHQPSRAG